jgi:glycosyltransferase involved in cell wall biosynthesis
MPLDCVNRAREGDGLVKVVVVLEHRFQGTPDGAVWTETGFAYEFWCRYLAVFDHVTVVARIREISAFNPNGRRADGAGVSFVPVAYYLGVQQYIVRLLQIRRSVKNAVGPTDAVILRVGSQVADIVEKQLRRTDHPFALEVVGDPYDVFAPGSFKHPLRPFFRWWFSRQLRQQCARAFAVAYVTKYALQRRYPPAINAFSTYYSNVELPDEAFVAHPRSAIHVPITLIFVGTLAQLYKAPDVLIHAVSLCVNQGLNLRLVMIGDGKYRPKLEAQATAWGLKDHVCFLGQLPAGEAIRTQLDQADLFVLPSYQEGLPRAMLEAMARALPCIGSTVGGLPELLPEEDMVPPSDAFALAEKIREVVNDPARMVRMSARNLVEAHEYRDSTLKERRDAFYGYVSEFTLQSQTAGSRQVHTRRV